MPASLSEATGLTPWAEPPKGPAMPSIVGKAAEGLFP
jgi:hypothetical protein